MLPLLLLRQLFVNVATNDFRFFFEYSTLCASIDVMHDDTNKSQLSYSDLADRGGRWSIEEEMLLYDGTKVGKSTSELAALHNRTQVAITSRQARLGLRENRHSKLIDPFPEFIPLSSSSLSELENTNKLNATKRAVKREKINKNYTTGNIEELIVENVVQEDEDSVRTDPIQALWQAIIEDSKRLKSWHDPPREQIIVLSRLDPNPSSGSIPTLQEIGSEFGITRERVRQISKRAQRKIFSASKLEEKNLGITLKLINSSFDLDEKSDEDVLSWYFSLLLNHKCTFEFAEGIFHSVIRFHRLKKMKSKDITEKYKYAFTNLKTEMQREVRREASLEAASSSANEFLMSVLKKSEFSGIFMRNLTNLSGFRPLRSVNGNRQIFLENLQKVVQWESHGERRFINAMANSSIIVDFVEQPIQIKYGETGNDNYIPDFLIRTEEGLAFIIEIKFRKQMADYTVMQKAEAASNYLGQLGVGYCLIDQNGFSIKDLKEVFVPEAFKNFLRAKLKQKRCIEFSDLYEFCNGPPDDEIIDQLQSLALNFPEKLRYFTQLTPIAHSEKPKFKFKLYLI
jgi:hypothetical protein